MNGYDNDNDSPPPMVPVSGYFSDASSSSGDDPHHFPRNSSSRCSTTTIPYIHKPQTTNQPNNTTMLLTGSALLRNPRYNKGLAFTKDERRKFKLEGLLPPRVFTQDDQVNRCFEQLDGCSSDLDRYIFMQNLLRRSHKLFFRVLNDRLEQLMPIVYTPVVGTACQKFGHIYSGHAGIYISIEDKGRIREILGNVSRDEVRGIVFTDGARILGLGDLGSFGMGIPIGKLQLYTACAGIDPEMLVPVMIDVGTNNETLLADPLYIGLRRHRVTDNEYDQLIDEFIKAVKDRWGENTLLQFEDFGNNNAFRLLEKYRDSCCTFNDDIQGTAAVTLAGILGSNRLSGKKLADHSILIVGAGEAGLGIAEMTAMALADEIKVPVEEARKSIFLVDSRGLITKDRPSGGITEYKLPFAHEHKPIDNLADAVDDLKPSILIGVTAQPGTFTEDVVKAVASYHEHPVIFPLSNPTSKAECTAEDAYKWTNGRCIFASGSPFEPVSLLGKTFVPGQGNNAYIFPGVALAIISTGARCVSDKMMFIAAEALCQSLTEQDLAAGRVYPKLGTIRSVSARIAAAVGEEIYRAGFATVLPKPSNMLEFMVSQQYDTSYVDMA